MDSTYSFFATSPKGVEHILAGELRSLGADRIKQGRGGVFFYGDLKMGYKACLWLRTANRVFLVVDTFKTDDTDGLYDGVRNTDWSEHMSPESTLAIDLNASQSFITHTHFGALKVKDAIVDQLREKYDERPSIDTSSPDIRVNVYVARKTVTVSLDLSGMSLHKRGYRSDSGLAPMKENLAAAILIKAGWPDTAARGGSFIDPMCGSGTLPIEAAMIAGKMAPGLLREYFGFIKWKKHQPDVWQELLDEAEEAELEYREKIPPIIGYDRDSSAVKDSFANLERAGLHGLVHFEKKDLTELTPHAKTLKCPGLILVNPPYGERLGEEHGLIQLYSKLGEKLRSRFMGWHAAVFTGNSKLAKKINIKPAQRDNFYNGSIPCELIQYKIDKSTALEQGSSGFAHIDASGYQPSDEIKMFENRVKKNMKRLKSWRKQNNISCFRIYDRDIPEYAVAVDVYGKWIHVQEYKAPGSVSAEAALKRLQDIIYVLPSIFNVSAENIFLKQRQRQKSTSQYEKRNESAKTATVEESGLKFEIDLNSYIDTGLFLDHRMTRAMIGNMAEGKRFLNLFSYTSSVTVYAARGGAVSTVSVDKSNTYTRWAKKNMALNGFDKKNHVFYSEDCLTWMKKEKKKYDLIFLDPPTFSNTKKEGTSFDIQKDHAELILAAVNLLSDNGTLIFSNNFRQFKMDFDRLKNLSIEDITSKTIPPDFERNSKIHNCWVIRQ